MKPDRASRLVIIPLTFPAANGYVTRWHRHHGPLPGGFAWFSVGVVDEAGRIVGVGIAGRPTNRNNDDGQTVEVLRVATTGHPNACSAIYGSLARASRAVGARRVITYTLDDESGASLRGSGWERQEEGIETWWHHAGSRTPAILRDHFAQTKTRWAVEFRPAVEVIDDVAESPSAQLEAFA